MPTLTPFRHDYALFIGVGHCQYDAWSLPVTVQDAQALRDLLVDPALCAYLDDENHLRLLHDEGATGAAILEGLAWLQTQTAADPQATALVYYSGHGWVDAQGAYYLVHHAVKPFDIANSALSATAFAQALRHTRTTPLGPHRLLPR